LDLSELLISEPLLQLVSDFRAMLDVELGGLLLVFIFQNLASFFQFFTHAKLSQLLLEVLKVL